MDAHTNTRAAPQPDCQPDPDSGSSDRDPDPDSGSSDRDPSPSGQMTQNLSFRPLTPESTSKCV